MILHDSNNDFKYLIYKEKHKTMKRIKAYNIYIREDIETPQEATNSVYNAHSREGETRFTDPIEELKL
jgi:hypothetical protein